MAEKTTSQRPSLAQLLRSRLSSQDKDDLQRVFGHRSPTSETQHDEGYSVAFEAVIPAVLRQQSLEGSKDPSGLLAGLSQYSQARQRFLIQNSSRYQSPRLVDLLAKQSAQASFDAPETGVHLAQLAVEIAETLQQGSSGLSESLLHDLEGKAKASLANALRALGNLPDAEQALAEAESRLEIGSGDLLLSAYCHSIRGALAGQRGYFTACFQAFDRAIRIYAECGEDQARSRLMVHKALFFGYAGETDKAIELLRAGISLADEPESPRLLIAAHHNLVLFLTDQGKIAEAKARLEAIRPTYYQLGDEANLLRLRWLEGRIALAERNLDEAEQAFDETRAGFVAKGSVWDTALVSLELASLYAEQKRTAEIQVLADEIIPLFKATGQQREALAALILFQKAAEMEKVSEQLIRATVAQLRSLRRDR